eukprot:scaffold105426_cov56-Phaeocystis_antarctica.AAC.2
MMSKAALIVASRACCTASSLVSGGAAAARAAATACPSGDRATHSAASSTVAKLPRLIRLPVAGLGEAHAVVTCLVVIRREQYQPLRLRLLPRLLARQRRRRRCSPLRSRPPLRRPCDAHRRLHGCCEVAKVHWHATALQLRPIGLRMVICKQAAVVHAEVARLAVGHAQRQPLRLRLLPRLLARQRRRRRRRSPLRRCSRLPPPRILSRHDAQAHCWHATVPGPVDAATGPMGRATPAGKFVGAFVAGPRNAGSQYALSKPSLLHGG